jgi:hypothetical protein
MKTERQDAFDDYTGPNPNEIHITLPRCPHCQEPQNQTSFHFGMDCINHCSEAAYNKYREEFPRTKPHPLENFFSKLTPNSNQDDVDKAMRDMMLDMDHEMPCDDDKDSTLDKC